jgi:hypothetical protein
MCLPTVRLWVIHRGGQSIKAGFNRETTMSISISTDHFEFDDICLVLKGFGYTICWMRGDSGLIVDRPDGSAWHWRKRHGRWTTLENGDIVDGWGG